MNLDFYTKYKEKFYKKIKKIDKCWIWQGYKNKKGYGKFYAGKQLYSHRYSYLIHKGIINHLMQIDHLCKNTSCCNPDHLEEVTQRINLLRGDTNTSKNAKKTHCPKGHEYFGNNLFYDNGSRQCKKCHSIKNKAYREKNKEKIKKQKKEYYIKCKQKGEKIEIHT